MLQQIESRSFQDPTDVVVRTPAATAGRVRAAVDRARVVSREAARDFYTSTRTFTIAAAAS